MQIDRVLVTYTSGSGSTADVARTIAATLRAEGLPVVVADARDVRELDLFSAVIVGSHPHPSRIAKEALRFLRRFRAELSTRSVAFLPHGYSDPELLVDWARSVAGTVRTAKAA